MSLKSIIVKVFQIGADAFVSAYRNVVQESAAQQHAKKAASETVAKAMNHATSIKPDVAMSILNIEAGVKREEFDEKFKKMFENNDVDKGGSFYIQSKLFRARESVLPYFDDEGILNPPQEKKD